LKSTLAFVPPGGGETEYYLEFELPGAPQPGDFISIARSGKRGTEDFTVRRTWWYLERSGSTPGVSEERARTGTTQRVTVECEFARSPYSSENHRRVCDAYDSSGLQVKNFDETAY
jgi:hypothetical protein